MSSTKLGLFSITYRICGDIRLFGLAEGLEIDTELLALLVEVAALQAERAGDIGHVEIVAANLAEEDFPFKDFGALGERAGLHRGGTARIRGVLRQALGDGQNEANVSGGNRSFAGEKHEALDHVAKLADVARPAVAAQLGNGVC